jgi:hypothetical protein
VRAHLRTSLGFRPSRAFPPIVRAFAFGRDADPRTLRRVYVCSRLGLRALRNEGIGWSVSGLPALLGFRTFRPSRRSAHRPGERAHGFTSRRRTLTHAPRALCSLEADATEDPGPSARRRRPFGARRAASSIRQRLFVKEPSLAGRPRHRGEGERANAGPRPLHLFTFRERPSRELCGARSCVRRIPIARIDSTIGPTRRLGTIHHDARVECAWRSAASRCRRGPSALG